MLGFWNCHKCCGTAKKIVTLGGIKLKKRSWEEKCYYMPCLAHKDCTHAADIGSVKNRRISLLLESGSSHSFISQALAKKLRLTTSLFSETRITVVNEDKIACNQVVKEFK